MLLDTATSKNGVQIRLTQERWTHITKSHLEIPDKDHSVIMKVISDPELILRGDKGELLAVRKKSRSKIWYVVPYKEAEKDGFVLTAYLTTDLRWLLHREVIWNKN